MFKCLSAGKYIRITMKGWKYDTIRTRTQFLKSALPHQAGIELSDFHARGWKSDQGGRNSMQEMHGNQTKCMEFRPIKENSNF